MRASQFGGLMAAVVVAASSAQALAAGPSSPLYVTNYLDLASGKITGPQLVQSATETSYPSTVYPSTVPANVPLSDHGDVAAAESSDAGRAARFDAKSLLDADAAYLNIIRGLRRNVASDGTYNYRLDYKTGEVIRFDQTWENPLPIFNVTDSLPGAGWITMNPADGSFWLSQWGEADLVAHFSPTGKLLSSFSSGVSDSVGLVFDPGDETLWIGDKEQNLYQFDQDGHFLMGLASIRMNYLDYSPLTYLGNPYVSAQVAVPEPSGLALAAVALVGLSAWRWRSASSRRR